MNVFNLNAAAQEVLPAHAPLDGRARGAGAQSSPAQ